MDIVIDSLNQHLLKLADVKKLRERKEKVYAKRVVEAGKN